MDESLPKLVPRGFFRKRVVEVGQESRVNDGSCFDFLLPDSFSKLTFNSKIVIVVTIFVVVVLVYRYYRKAHLARKRERKRRRQLRRLERQKLLEAQRYHKETFINSNIKGSDESENEIWANRGGGFFEDPTPASGPSGFTVFRESH